MQKQIAGWLCWTRTKLPEPAMSFIGCEIPQNKKAGAEEGSHSQKSSGMTC
jgi:hypothetical protein